MLSSPDPAQLAARSVGAMRPPPPPSHRDAQPSQSHQPPAHPPQPPQTPPPPKAPNLKVEDFRHDPATGTFSVALPTGVTLTSKNPFELQSKVLMSAKPEIRPALASMMTDVTMQWSACTTPSLQDVANDAVDDSRKAAYLESAKLLCSVRQTVPAPKLDLLRHKCMTMPDTVKWLLDMEAAKPEDVVHKTGLAHHNLYHLSTGKLNEAGKTAVDNLSDSQRKSLNQWFNRSESDVHQWVLGRCLSSSESGAHLASKPLHGVHRVCVYNLRKAYDNQADSIRKAISDHDKLKKGRLTILIFVAVLLAVVIIVVVIVVVMKNKKKAREARLTLPTQAHHPDTTAPPVLPHLTASPLTLPSTMAGLNPSHGATPVSHVPNDPMDAEIERLALEIPK